MTDEELNELERRVNDATWPKGMDAWRRDDEALSPSEVLALIAEVRRLRAKAGE